MTLIEKIRTRLHHHFLAKEVKELKRKRSSMFLDNASNIGILFDGTEPKARETVLKYASRLQKEGKRVKLLAFLDQKSTVSEFTFHYFDRKDLDWALRPLCQAAKSFEEQTFDLVLNLTQKAVAPLDYIAAKSKARFRVGPITETVHCYDLMLDVKTNSDLEHFIKQIGLYLSKMQSAPKKRESVAAF